MKSIIVTDTEHCLICGAPYPEEHHCLYGTANRPIAEKYHLTVPLCNKHHTGSGESPHRNRVVDLCIKVLAQTVYENQIGTREQFRKEFGKSYL